VTIVISFLIGLQIVSPAFRDWTSDGYRFLLWEQLLPHIIETPPAGYGYGQETPPRVLSSVYDQISFDKNHTFNTFFNVVFELGLVGLALFVFLLWRLGRSLWRGICRTSEPSLQVFFLCALMILVGFMVRNQFDHMFRDAPGHLFWILMGLGVGRAVALGAEPQRSGP
jgi:O-antigen ligase